MLIIFEFCQELSIRKKKTFVFVPRAVLIYAEYCTCIVYVHYMPLETWMILNACIFIIFKVKSKTCLYKLKNVAWSLSSTEVLDKHRNYPLNTSHQLPQATVCSVIQHTWQRVLSPSQSVCMVIWFHMHLLNLWTYFCKRCSSLNELEKYTQWIWRTSVCASGSVRCQISVCKHSRDNVQLTDQY